MTNDPKKFRYDSVPQHKVPPEGLKPTVNEPKKVELSSEQQERRKKLLAQMKETMEVERTREISSEAKEGAVVSTEAKEGTINSQNLPFDYEMKHPAEEMEETEESNISRYRITLSKALETPEMKSIRFGVIGAGQCGGRIAEVFARFGYPVCVINTAEQDLAFLNIPDANKLHLPYALGGAGKNLLVGQQAATENIDSIKKLLATNLSEIDQILITVGGGGGSGAGALVPLLEAVMSTESISGLPVVVIYTLPMNDEGALAKSNAVKTLERIAAMVNDDLISSLIIVDNAKIQENYPTVSVKDFWELANFDIVNHLNMFNTVSKCATNYDALDPMDFANIVSTGGCLIYGKVEVPVKDQSGQIILDETQLGNALIRGISEGTLAEGFDVRQAVNIGVIITGSDEVLSQIPAINVNYAFNVLAEEVGEDCSIYRGMYADDTASDSLTVYTIFAGLGLPRERIHSLREEANQILQKQESKRKTKLSLSDDNVQKKQDPYAEMRQNNTSVGRMIQRRRRQR